MNKNDITYCLFSSTKGHFGRTDRYKLTVDNMLSQVPASTWSRMIAHIKVTPGDEVVFEEMKKFLELRGFEVVSSVGDWKHGNDGQDNSHQIEYIKDMTKVNSMIETQYFFHAEDDFLIKTNEKELAYYLSYSQKHLFHCPELIQVRIARFGNEFERINQLKRKHNINTKAVYSDNLTERFFYHSDWSNNPYLARTRDMRAALTFVNKGALPQHSEHGVGAGMKLLSKEELPILTYCPTKIHCTHIGTKIGEEDNLNSPAMETLLQ